MQQLPATFNNKNKKDNDPRGCIRVVVSNFPKYIILLPLSLPFSIYVSPPPYLSLSLTLSHTHTPFPSHSFR